MVPQHSDQEQIFTDNAKICPAAGIEPASGYRYQGRHVIHHFNTVFQNFEY